MRSRARSGLRVLAGERHAVRNNWSVSLCGELSCDSKLKITKDLVTQTQDHTAPLNSRLKITQQLLTQPNSSESRDALRADLPCQKMRNDECGYNVKICDGMAGPERGQAMARLVFVSFYLNHGSEQPTLYLYMFTYVFTSRDGLVEAYMCIHTAYMCTAPLPIGIAWPCSAALAIGSRPALARTHGRPRTHARTSTHTHKRTHGRPRTHTRTHAYTRARTPARTHTRTRTRTFVRLRRKPGVGRSRAAPQSLRDASPAPG